jgi:hypothetical protein
MLHVGPEVGVVPVRLTKIEIDLQPMLSTRIHYFANNIAPKKRLHNAAGEVTLLEARAAGMRPVDPAADTASRVVHGETFVMIRREGKHLHAVFMEEAHPCVRIERGRVPGLVLFVVAGFLRRREFEKGPARVPPVLQPVESPVDSNSILDVPKGFERGLRSMMVIRTWLGNVFAHGPPALVRFGYANIALRRLEGLSDIQESGTL